MQPYWENKYFCFTSYYKRLNNVVVYEYPEDISHFFRDPSTVSHLPSSCENILLPYMRITICMGTRELLSLAVGS